MLLEALGLRERKGVDLIACPACGRAEIDVYKVAQEAMAALEQRQIPLQVAVMGCVVNGPGGGPLGPTWGIAPPAATAATCSSGATSYGWSPEDEMVSALVEEAEKLVKGGLRRPAGRGRPGGASRSGSRPPGPARREGR